MTTIAIIGTGNVGGALGVGRREGRLRRHVRRAGRGQGADRRRGAGAPAAATVREAVAGADIVVLAVPYAAVADVAAEIAPVAAGKVVIDPTNPLKADYSGPRHRRRPVRRRGLAPPAARRQGRQGVQHHVRRQRRATRGRSASSSTRCSPRTTRRRRTPCAACRGSIGFRPIHVGPLAAARELEAMAWLNIRLQLISNGSWNTAYALVAPPEAAADLRQVAACTLRRRALARRRAPSRVAPPGYSRLPSPQSRRPTEPGAT